LSLEFPPYLEAEEEDPPKVEDFRWKEGGNLPLALFLASDSLGRVWELEKYSVPGCGTHE
jgi:hypothetical protein